LSVELLKPLLEVVVEMVSFILVHLVSVVLLFLEILNTSSSIVANSEDGEVLVGVVLHLDLFGCLELGVSGEVGIDLEAVHDHIFDLTLDDIAASAGVLVGGMVGLDLVRVKYLLIPLLQLVSQDSGAAEDDGQTHDDDEDAAGLLLLVNDLLLLVRAAVRVFRFDLLLPLDYNLVVRGRLVLDDINVGGEGFIGSGVALVGGSVCDLDGVVAGS